MGSIEVSPCNRSSGRVFRVDQPPCNRLRPIALLDSSGCLGCIALRPPAVASLDKQGLTRSEMGWHIRNPIVRIGESPTEHFVMIPNALARDVILSNHAFRLAIILRTHADGWEVSAKSLAEDLGWSRTTVSNALKELVEAKLLAIRKVRTHGGTRAYEEYFVPVSRRFTEEEMADLNVVVKLPPKGAPHENTDMPPAGASGCVEAVHVDVSAERNKEHQQEHQQEDDLEHQPSCWVCGDSTSYAGELCGDCVPRSNLDADSSFAGGQECWGCRTNGRAGCSVHTPRRPTKRREESRMSVQDFAASVLSVQ